MVEYFGDGETEAMLDLLGQDVTVGDVDTKGLVNLPGAIVQRGVAPGTVTGNLVIVVRTNAIPDARVNDTVTWEGTDYKIRRRLAIEDGGITELHVSKAS